MRKSANLAQEAGFTLIEVLMALTVFALIAALAYAALGSAGSGFAVLGEVRTTQEKSAWIARQLRSDMLYISAAPFTYAAAKNARNRSDKPLSLRIENDNRGDIEFDHLWLLVREPGQASISQVHYYIDEDIGHLIRESRPLLARKSIDPIRWDLGEISSWAVQVWDKDGNARQDWDFRAQTFVWPRAVTIKLQVQVGEGDTKQREWLFPILLGHEL